MTARPTSRRLLLTLVGLASIWSPGVAGDPPQCASPVAIVGTLYEDSRITIETHNPFPIGFTGWFVVSFEVSGTPGDFAAEVDYEPGLSYEDTLTFSGPVSIIGVTICSQRPNGITDSAEPVGHERKKKDK